MRIRNRFGWVKPCAILLVLALLLTYGIPFLTTGRVGETSAELSLSFEGIGQGKDPKGNAFDIGELKSDEVLTAALEQSGLQDELTVDQLRTLIAIRPAVGRGALEQLLSVESPSGKTEAVSEKIVYPSQFDVRLKDEGLPSAFRDRKLLENVLAAYRDDLRASYLMERKEEPVYTEEEIFRLDYPEEVELISQQADSLILYAASFMNSAPDYVSKETGRSFSDYYEQATALRDTELGNIRGVIDYYMITRDGERRAKYEDSMLRRANLRVEQTEGAAQIIRNAMDVYDNGGFMLASTDMPLSEQQTQRENEYYNQLTNRYTQARTAAIGASYERNDILKRMEKLSRPPLNASQSAVQGEAQEASLREALEKSEVIRTGVRELAEEYYEKNIGAKISVSGISYHPNSMGNLPLNLILLLLLWGAVRIAKRSEQLRPFRRRCEEGWNTIAGTFRKGAGETLEETAGLTERDGSGKCEIGGRSSKIAKIDECDGTN